MSERLLKSAESWDDDQIIQAIEALEDILRTRTGEPRQLLGTAAAAAILGVAPSTVSRAIAGASKNEIQARVAIETPRGPIIGLAKSDLKRWSPRSVGRPPHA